MVKSSWVLWKLGKNFFIPLYLKESVDARVKHGGLIGVFFAGAGYIVVYRLGFTQFSLNIMLYLYIILGIIMAFDFRDFLDRTGFLERIVIVAEEEELKMKKLFTGEEYRVDGTVEKV